MTAVSQAEWGKKVLLLSMKVLAVLAWRSMLSLFYLIVCDTSFCLVFCLLIFHIFGGEQIAYLLFAACYFYMGISLNLITTRPFESKDIFCRKKNHVSNNIMVH